MNSMSNISTFYHILLTATIHPTLAKLIKSRIGRLMMVSVNVNYFSKRLMFELQQGSSLRSFKLRYPYNILLLISLMKGTYPRHLSLQHTFHKFLLINTKKYGSFFKCYFLFICVLFNCLYICTF